MADRACPLFSPLTEGPQGRGLQKEIPERTSGYDFGEAVGAALAAGETAGEASAGVVAGDDAGDVCAPTGTGEVCAGCVFINSRRKALLATL